MVQECIAVQEITPVCDMHVHTWGQGCVVGGQGGSIILHCDIQDLIHTGPYAYTEVKVTQVHTPVLEVNSTVFCYYPCKLSQASVEV